MIVIGLGCKKGVGKTSVAQMLVRAAGFEILSFGDQVKVEAAERFRFEPGLAYSEQGKATTILHHELPNGMGTVRECLQRHGHERRLESPTYWDDYVFQRIRKMKGSQTRIVVDDVRHPTEKIGLVSLFNARMFRINPYPAYVLKDKHYSEVALDDDPFWTMELYPDYGAEHLRRVAARILMHMNLQ